MNKFTEDFYKLDGEYRKLKVESVVIDKKGGKISVAFIGLPEYLDGLGADGRMRVKKDVEGLLATFFHVETTFKKAYADAENIRARIFDFLNSEYPSVAIGVNAENSDVAIERGSNVISVGIGADGYMKSYADSIKLDEKIAEFLSASYFEVPNVKFFVDENAVSDYKIRESAPAFMKNDMIFVSDNEKVCGKTILSYPKTIKSISAEADNAVLCGKISRMTRREAKTTGNPYYIFELTDPTGSISAKLFPRKKGGINSKFSDDGEPQAGAAAKKSQKHGETDAIESLKDNEEIIVAGAIRQDIYSKDLVILVNDINRCKIDFSGIEKDGGLNEAGEEYIRVKPEKYVGEERQQDFFSVDEEIPGFLKGKEFTVFDCETTGLDRNNDKIIELAAVKIKDGRITETFRTFLNPAFPLSPEITKLTGITDDDLKAAPKIEEVFHDFYKFIGKAPIVAHNIEFDIEFIRRAAKKTNFHVDRKSVV
jgi:DNA polymerase III alpha subunit (gram-positive type)